MSTIVCQNLVSCFESQLMTETTAALKLRVAVPPPPPLSPAAALDFGKMKVSDDHTPPAEVKSKLDNFGNWGFLQTVPKESATGDIKTEINNFYTHPFTKKSSFSRLSPKSLELCTENLGSETGTDIITDTGSGSSIFSSPPPSSPSTPRRKTVDELDNSDKKTNTHKNPHHKEANSGRNFPPPLTTMRGSSSLQVHRHREGGRLIIEAVEAPFRNSYLQAERSDGRLRLCFLTASERAETATSAGGEEEDEEEEEYACGGKMAAAEEEEEDEEEEEIEEPINEFESEKEEFDEEINLETGMEKFQWVSRCKEGGHGNKGLCSNWKRALWVATS